jgi:hypothetical protein
MSEPTIHMRLTELTVSAVPESSINHYAYAVTVQWRGEETYAVTHLGHCLGADGTWDYERRPSSREEDWRATHRFDYETAVRLAVEAAPRVVVNGRTALEAVARESSSPSSSSAWPSGSAAGPRGDVLPRGAAGLAGADPA